MLRDFSHATFSFNSALISAATFLPSIIVAISSPSFPFPKGRVIKCYQ
jgi:hypothetical protein